MCEYVLLSRDRKDFECAFGLLMERDGRALGQRAFKVPRILYELVYMRASIENDVAQSCHCSSPISPTIKGQPCCQRVISAPKRCWHVHHFHDEGDNNEMKDAIFRQNALLLDLYAKTNDPHELLDNEVDFFTHLDRVKHRCKLLDYFRGRGGIDVSFDARMVEIAHAILQLELDNKDGTTLLYRGAELKNESPVYQDAPYVLSYGTSVFAGLFHDPEACAWFYMRKRDAFALAVPDDLVGSVFYVPKAHTLAQFYADGETFHPRSMAWSGCEHFYGVNIGAHRRQVRHLKSPLDRDAFLVAFNKVKPVVLSYLPGVQSARVVGIKSKFDC